MARLDVSKRALGLVGLLGVLAVSLAPSPRGLAGPVESDAARRTALGRDAASSGRPHVARRHFLDALAIDPGHGTAWADLAALDADDADARTLWALDAALSTTDLAGKPPKSALPPPLAPADTAALFTVTAKRAALARAVVESAGRLSGSGHVVVARWLRALADETCEGTSALALPAIAAAEKALERCRPDGGRLRAALLAALRQAEAAGEPGRAVVAARLALGLAQQRKGVDPKAPAPERMGPLFALDRARTALAAASPPPMAFADLKALLAPAGAAGLAKRLAFEDAHASWASPIVVRSERGRYRIESTCGLSTTLEAAVLVEHCHDRLVAWTGADPFAGRPGVVRLCRSHADLDAEGAPYWWAQGFQAGDVTTVLVRWTEGDDLARLLAHELTHRFDGVLHRGVPAWAGEGRAVYVAAITPSGRAKALDERLVDAGELVAAYRITGRWTKSLTDVLDGTDPEYRHNYPVGYAVWTFLSQWTGRAQPPGGPAPYRDRLPALLAALAAAPGKPLDAFRSTLCDGRDGRAPDVEQLAKQLFDFLDGFHALDTPPWAEAWMNRTRLAGEGRGWDPDLTDRSNHPTDRTRFDAPAEGEGLAAMAAAFLESVGRAGDAAEAHALADAADEVDVDRYRRALALDVAAGRRDAAFARRRLIARVDPAGAESAPETDPPGSAAAAARRWTDALAKATQEALAAGRPRTARALRALHDRAAGLCGVAPLGLAGLEPPPPLAAGASHGSPDCPPATNPLAAGLVEERWAPQEDGAVSGLWFQPSSDEVELGRKAGGDVTGPDRDARWVGVAVRTVESLAGTYTVRMRVRPAGAYVDGRVILGWTRRDRGVEFAFRAGDAVAALRRGESEAGSSGVDTSISDLRTVDVRAANLARSDALSTAADGTAGFDLALHVAGPYVRVQIQGKDALSFRRVTGEPVEGWLGFAIDRGRTLFSEVRVERHRSLGPDRACRCDRFDAPFDLGATNGFSWTSLVGRRTVGLAPSKHVRLVLWSTGFVNGDPSGADSIHDALRTCRGPFEVSGYPVDVHVAVRGEPGDDGALEPPRSFPLAQALKIPEGNLHLHRGFPGLDADVENIPHREELGWPGWGGIFVDPSGIVRSRAPIDSVHHGLRLTRWTEGH